MIDYSPIGGIRWSLSVRSCFTVLFTALPIFLSACASLNEESVEDLSSTLPGDVAAEQISQTSSQTEDAFYNFSESASSQSSDSNEIPTKTGTFEADSNKQNTEGFTIEAVDLPLEVLLYSLAKEAQLQLNLDAPIATSVTVHMVDQPLPRIMEQLSSQTGIRWHISEGTLTVLSKEPYLQSYTIDYLNMSRKATSRVGLATQVGSINLAVDSQEGSAGFSNSSQSVIENESLHQFWESLSADVQMILSAASESAADLMINRDVGLLTMRGSAKQHRDVSEYLHKLKSVSQRQVLIEATVVEVALSDQFQAGIDWRALSNAETGVNFAQIFHGLDAVDESTVNKLPTPTALFSAVHQSQAVGRLSATLRLLRGYGDVKILSRPQIIAINNQSAILKVVDNRVYFSMTVDRQSSEGVDDVSTSTEIHTVPVGLVMSVTPFIIADSTVILNVRPTISRILGFVNDPNPELAAANVSNGVPEIQVREMESVLKVPDREIVMIGGLMQQQNSINDQDVPYLSDIPGFGRLFRSRSKQKQKTELLVFLQPTVLEAS